MRETSTTSAVRDAIVHLHRQAQLSFPTVALALDVFLRAVAAHVDATGDPLAALERLNTEEMYLAIACGEGDPAALAIFESTYLPQVSERLRRTGFTAVVVDETLQRTRTALFVARADRAPRIREFAGRGQLRRWLQVVASRLAYEVARPVRGQVSLEDSLPADTGGDLELAFLKKSYGAIFRSAFREALASLPAADRILLKQKLSQNLTVVELGRLYGVHGSSVSRRVTDARNRLVEATRAAMMRRLHLDAPQLSSILRLIHSEIDISLSTYSDADLHDLSG